MDYKTTSKTYNTTDKDEYTIGIPWTVSRVLVLQKGKLLLFGRTVFLF